jgi:lipopolysaccharide/colanic/teichoic acid biosynthesis glycosyltransferase
VWLPIVGLVAVVVRAKLGVPVFFRQERPGRAGRIFEIIKFRSMIDARDAAGQLRPDAERLTSFGRRLRALSLDELPELFNVLRGDMSLVGPRPLMVRYLPRYSPEQARRHEVLPGVTGLAQINGRNTITWDDKFRLDVEYADNISCWLDVKILFLTVWKVWRQEGIIDPHIGSHQEFTGTVTVKKEQDL